MFCEILFQFCAVLCKIISFVTRFVKYYFVLCKFFQNYFIHSTRGFSGVLSSAADGRGGGIPMGYPFNNTLTPTHTPNTPLYPRISAVFNVFGVRAGDP